MMPFSLVGASCASFSRLSNANLGCDHGTLEWLDVIAVPAFVSELQRVRAAHMREHVAPVIVVLDEIALREAHAVGLAAIGVDSVHRDGRDRVVLGATAQHTFDPASLRR